MKEIRFAKLSDEYKKKNIDIENHEVKSLDSFEKIIENLRNCGWVIPARKSVKEDK